jgi:hypothetical protein
MFVAFSYKQRCTCPSCHQKRTSVSYGGQLHSSYHTTCAFIATLAVRSSSAIDLVYL